MQTSHIISDTVLSSIGFFVFFKYLIKLNVSSTLLWESFILSVAVAAGFGALRFAGVAQMGAISIFFQKVASTVGAVGLIAASYSLIAEKQISRTTAYIVLGIGFVLLGITEFYELTKVRNLVAMVGLPIVALFGIWAIVKGKTKAGLLLLGGVGFAALAVFSTKFTENPSDSIDAYHYLLALSVLCFGMAASFR